MREVEFKEWLIVRGVSLKSVSTRTHAIRTIERNLEQLGFDQPDLDTIVQDDEFDNLRERLSGLRRDAQDGGDGFRILMPQSDNPEKRLISWKSWLGQYEQFVDANANAPETDYDELYAIWDDFLEQWPLDRLRTMSLSEYTKAGDQNTFSYWLEARLDKMGSIWGGSAFKFGVYSRKDPDDKENSSGRSYSNEYGWYTRLGASADEAFENVRAAIVIICQAASCGNLAIIQKETRLGLSIKWKIAFHYQGRDNPIIVDVFKKKSIQSYLGDNENKSLDLLHPLMMANKPGEQGILEYGASVWSKILDQQEEQIEVSVQTETSDKETLATNLILYGPPGTGKTYRTAEEAVRLCNGTANFPETEVGRKELMKSYRQLVEARQIEFVTFHQNFSYEEFVEGLRPETGSDEEDNPSGTGFRLETRQGIFREISLIAEQAQESATSGKAFDLLDRKVFKMSLGRAGIEDHIFESAIEGGFAILGYGGEIDWTPYASYESIHERWNQDHPGTNGNDANIVQTARFRADMKEGDIIVVSHGNHKIRAIGEIVGPYRFETCGIRDYNHRRDVNWLKIFDEPIPSDIIYNVPLIQWSCYMLKDQKLNKAALANLIPGTGGPTERPKQFVLIIDEINRANISKVFGELITLLEPDKRLGMPNALKVRLPYSKKEFGVPANLHIIGTMNTADRSIAQLDTALRRRFRFEELAPDSTVPAFQKAQTDTGLALAAMLDAMNKRIEYLVDRDHRIGHAFFIGCETKEDVDIVMRDSVIPLLQEYFFDDWNRLAAVLGERDRGGNFLECETIEDPMGDGGEPLNSWHVRKDFELEAYDRLIGKAAAATFNPESFEPETGEE